MSEGYQEIKKDFGQRLKISEEMYKALFEFSPYAIVIIDKEGNIIRCNSKAEKLIGCIDDKCCGINVRDWPLFSKKDKDKILNEINKLLKGLKTEVKHLKFVDNDGKIVWTEAWFSLIKLEEEKLIQIIIHNISEKKEAEKKLKESEIKYRMITENIYDFICILNEKFEIEYINEEVTYEHLGYKNKDIVGKSVLEFIHPEDYKKAYESIKRGFEKGTEIDVLRFRHKDGHWVWLEARGRTFIDHKGKTKALVVSRDVSKRIEMQEKLRFSEEKHKEMIKNLDLGYFNIGIDGKILAHNPAFSTIHGFSSYEDLTGTYSIRFWKNPEERKKYLRTIIRDKQIRNYIVYSKAINGKDIVVELNAHLIEDKNGNPISIEGTIADITEKYHLQRKLEKFNKELEELVNKRTKDLKTSEEKYRLITENSSDLIIIINIDRKIEFVNNLILFKLLGYKKQAFLNKDLESFIYSEDKERYEKFIKKIKKKGSSSLELRYITKDFSEIWFHVIGNKFKDGEGNEKILLISRDITKKKEAEILIQQEIIKLKELDKLRKDLITRISHELKTPIMAIAGASEFLLDFYKDKLDKESIKLVKIIERGKKRLKKLVDNLLDVSKIEYKKFELNKNEFNFANLIRECVNEFKLILKEKHINFNINVPANLMCEGDIIRIRQVLSNLISNAIKNTPPNGKISVFCVIKGNKLKFSIRDTGIGLTNDEMKLLFTRFGKIERHEPGTEFLDIQGSGLGLFISKEIIEAHGGKIWAESEGRNKGATFKFILPLSCS
ncbi:MAG: PAS domain-containing sensor histidine kinase [Promethearchaeia archaeon]